MGDGAGREGESRECKILGSGEGAGIADPGQDPKAERIKPTGGMGPDRSAKMMWLKILRICEC